MSVDDDYLEHVYYTLMDMSDILSVDSDLVMSIIDRDFKDIKSLMYIAHINDMLKENCDG